MEDFDQQLEDLKKSIFEFQSCTDIEIKSLLLSNSYQKLNDLLSFIKFHVQVPISKQSKVLKLKSALMKAHEEYLQEVDFQFFIQDAIKLSEVLRQKNLSKPEILLLAQSIQTAAEKIDVKKLSTKDQKLYYDAILLTSQAKEEEIVAKSCSSFQNPKVLESIHTIDNQNQLIDVVQFNTVLHKLSCEMVQDLIDSGSFEQDSKDFQQQDHIQQHSQDLARNRNVISKLFDSIFELFQPLMQSLKRATKKFFGLVDKKKQQSNDLEQKDQIQHHN